MVIKRMGFDALKKGKKTPRTNEHASFHPRTCRPEVEYNYCWDLHKISITAAAAAAVLAMYLVRMDLNGVAHGCMWGHTTQRIGMARERDREDRRLGGRAGQHGRTVTNRGLILEDRGLPILVISHTCSEMGNDRPWRKTRAQCKTGGRKEKSTGFRSLGTNLKEEKENYWVDFQWKKSVYLIIESFRIKRQSRKLPKPFSGTHQLQRKVLEPSVRTLSDTLTHTHN